MSWLLASLCLMTLPAHAQDAATDKATLLRALRLPTATHEARVLGMPDRDIRTILGMSRENRIPVGVLTETFEEQNKAVREYGPVDNFGAFVQAQLSAGLRGKDLAAAIKTEHMAHGKGKDHVKAMGAKGPARAADKANDKSMNKSRDEANEKSRGKSGH
jgi:hypothetical protein